MKTRKGGRESDNLMDLVIPDQREDMRYFISSLFENGYGENEFNFQEAGKGSLPVEIVATTLQGTSQPGTIAACFSRDMRVRKSLEEELIRSERLAIMGQMSAGLAHEINNPLGIIAGHAQDLLGYEQDDETRKASLKVITDNAKRAGRIVNELLSFSRQKQPVCIPVDLIDIIEASLMFVKTEVKRKNISVIKYLPQKPLSILGDENQLIQVFVNLLLNAIQAVKEKGEITIRKGQQALNDKEMTIVEIQDNGQGIKDAEVEKVFQPFYSTKETGFGLGLFISSIIVERHNGLIQAESEEGRGTVMRVSLPLNPAPGSTKEGDSHA